MVRLLVATDGSAHAMRAATFAARLAGELRAAEVILLNVGHMPATVLAAPAAGAAIDFGGLETRLEKSGQAILAKTGEQFREDVPVSRWYRAGDPATEIINAAKTGHADAIVMGTRGLGQIGGLILGSVSERVLHGASVPVIVVR